MSHNLLEVTQVTKTYGQKKANREINLSVRPGQIFGLLGPNGAGKTTLLRMINRIFYPDSGQILFNGHVISSQDLQDIGYLPEERGMYKEMTVAHQLKYFARLKGLSKSEAEASLTKWSEKFGVTDWLEKKVEELSKGMQQKIQFIGTVMHNPKLLILDEPFSGLDPVNTNLLKREIYRLKDDGLGIIFSTHRMEQAEEICEDIALINRGRIALEGNLQEVKERYKDYTYQIRTEPKQLESPEKLVENPSTQLQADKEGYILAVDSDAQANEVLSKLLRQGYEVREFREKLPSLNQIFIQVVENGETQDSEEVNRRDDEDQEGSKSSESSQESEGESIDKDIETRQEDSSEPDSEEKPKASTKVEVTPENKS